MKATLKVIITKIAKYVLEFKCLYIYNSPSTCVKETEMDKSLSFINKFCL